MKYDSAEMAKILRVKHAYLVNRIRNIITDIDRIKDDPSHKLQFLCENFKCESLEKEYKGNNYIGYRMNKPFFLLVLSRLKGKIAMEMSLWLIFGYSSVEKEAKKMSEISQAFRQRWAEEVNPLRKT